MVTEDERRELVRLTKRAHVNRALAFRARLVLACADGIPNTAVARRHRTSKATVGKWRTRFVERRLDGLYDEPRIGAPRTVSDEAVEAVIVKTLETTAEKRDHWSTRTMAAKAGLSHTMVGRIWRSFGLKPHITRVLQDLARPSARREGAGCRRPVYESAAQCGGVRLRREVADPSARAGSTHLADGRRPARTANPNYLRNGTLDLFAALNVATGEVLARCKQRHRAQDFVAFLREIDANVDARSGRARRVGQPLGPPDAGGAPMAAAASARPFHFTPTYASWLNLVERFFGLLTEKALKRGSHTSIPQLRDAILAYVDAHNENGKPFEWTKTADEILDKMRRFGIRTQQVHGAMTGLLLESRFQGTSSSSNFPIVSVGCGGSVCSHRSFDWRSP